MNYAELSKYGSSTIQFGYNFYYLDLKDFQNEDYLYFKVTLEFGFFTTNYLIFNQFSELPSSPETYVYQIAKFCSEEIGNNFNENFYYQYNYNFKIPKPKDNYIIISPPGAFVDTSLGGKMTIKNSEFECSGIIQENYYLDGSTGEYKKCYDTCKKCSGPGDETNHNCDQCIDNYIFLKDPLVKENNCLIKCDNYYYFDENNKYSCTQSNKCPDNYKLIKKKEKCINDCVNDNKYIYEYNNECVDDCPVNIKKDDEDKKCLALCPSNKFEYENTCVANCPSDKYKIYTDRNICTDNIPENYYYLDEINQIYKPCYDTCLKCYGSGNKDNNNCKECKPDFIPLFEPNKEKNCLPCKFNYYIADNSYFCTDSSDCPINHKNIIREKNRCTNKCKNDNIYQYEYNNICLEKCPNGTYYTETVKVCYDNNITKENAAQNEIDNIRKNLLNGDLSSEDNIFQIGNATIQITNTEMQKNNSNKNMSTIDLGECENVLREKHNLKNTTLPLLIFKVDYYPNDSLIPIIGYEVYSPIDLTMLNLSYCSNNTVKVNIPVKIDEDNLCKYDPSCEYYTNSCYSYTTENGTDILLKDRQKEYGEKNLSLCENKCKYITYDQDNKKSSCSCLIKNEMETISDIINNPNKLANEFASNDKTTSSSNMLSMKCVKNLLTIDGLKTNISSYILISIIFYFLFSIVSFVKCGLPSLKLKIKKIINSKNKQKNNQINNQLTGSYGNKKFRFNKMNRGKRKNNKSFPPKKVDFKFMDNVNQNQKYKRDLKSNNKNRRLNIFSEDINQNDTKNKENKNKSKSKNSFSASKTKKNFIKNLLISNYNDYELNYMDYAKAILFDKRSCCRYYISLLKIKHPLLFGFCPFNDYNTLIIKSCIFFLSFCIYYIINFLFFTEEMIHKIYEDGGKYNILYFLPTLSISFAISHVLTIIIKFIFLSERNILEIKSQLSFTAAYKKSLKVEKNIKIKYVLFFLFGLIFLFGFWLILSSFGAVYKNSQIILIMNTLISFGIEFIYPFFVNIFASFFRICSLSTKKRNLGCIYCISKFFQLL